MSGTVPIGPPHTLRIANLGEDRGSHLSSDQPLAMTTSRGDPLLVVENLSAPPFGSSPPLWAGVSFTVKPSTILCLVRRILEAQALQL